MSYGVYDKNLREKIVLVKIIECAQNGCHDWFRKMQKNNNTEDDFLWWIESLRLNIVKSSEFLQESKNNSEMIFVVLQNEFNSKQITSTINLFLLFELMVGLWQTISIKFFFSFKKSLRENFVLRQTMCACDLSRC